MTSIHHAPRRGRPRTRVNERGAVQDEPVWHVAWSGPNPALSAVGHVSALGDCMEGGARVLDWAQRFVGC